MLAQDPDRLSSYLPPPPNLLGGDRTAFFRHAGQATVSLCNGKHDLQFTLAALSQGLTAPGLKIRQPPRQVAEIVLGCSGTPGLSSQSYQPSIEHTFPYTRHKIVRQDAGTTTTAIKLRYCSHYYMNTNPFV